MDPNTGACVTDGEEGLALDKVYISEVLSMKRDLGKESGPLHYGFHCEAGKSRP